MVAWMKKLNREAGALAVEFGLRGGTDVTGYSLLGHGLEMANASGVGFRLEMEKIPFVSCAQKYAGQGTFPGGAYDNRLHFGPKVRFATGISEEEQMLLFDPQTSGGLLLPVPGSKVAVFLKRAEELGQPAWVIGDVIGGEGIEITN